ncbi:MAG: glycosyltransferase family 2 protein [Lysobacteraceae bacterium]|nr:MAG: glycosyltransferase family 2 protein [Xanthomonadaceae bacterium]
MKGRTELVLLPAHHLERSDAEAGTGLRTWIATGEDPQFLLSPSDGSRIDGGWYLFDTDLRPIDKPIKQPVLYPDYGSGQNELNRIPLPIKVAAGGAAPVLVRFDHALQSLRYDPTMSSGSFALGPVRLQRIGKWRAGSLMLSQSLGTCADWRGKMQVLVAAASTLLTSGPRGLAEWLYQKVLGERVEATLTNDYASWLRQYDTPVPSDIDGRLAGLARKPLVSVVMPTYNTPERWLRKCIDSVRGQAYPHWELCIADDASTKRHVRKVLAEYERLDPRIKVVYRAENGHISDASNSALALARGEYVALLDHDDELHPMALYEVVKAVNDHPRWKLVFSDEDKMDEAGRRSSPYFKADWNYDLLLSQNCVSHLGVYDTRLMRDVGGFRKGFEGSQDHDLTLRCVERLEPAQIGHIPKVLYHWRMVEGSTARGASEKNYAATAGCRAISEHLQRSGVKAEVEVTMQGYYKVRYALPEPPPFVSLIIPTRDKVELLRVCVESILARTDYPDYEILVVDNQSSEQSALDYLDSLQSQPRVRVLRYDAPFNFSAINNFAARHARGEVLGLINNDLEINQPGWLRELTSHACREGVGAVGCLLYYPDDTIQHAGVLTGLHGVAGHIGVGKGRKDPGYFGRGQLVQNLSAVTAACLVVRKRVFDEVGGLDEGLTVAFNDIDFCLRLGRAGYRNVWTPHAEAYHHESASRGAEDTPVKRERFRQEVEFMNRRWGESLKRDPAYNPNLTLTGYPFEMAFPPSA